MQTGVVSLGRGVARGRDDADPDVLAEQIEHPRDNGGVRFEGLPVVIEGNVSVESGELQGAVRGYRHDLGRVEDQTDVVERGRDETAGRDVAFAVLVFETRFEGEAGEEGAYCWYQELEFGRERVLLSLVVD
jgi:hypothetical protein